MAARKNWFFTLHLEEDELPAEDGEPFAHHENISFLKCQVEICPTTGSLHWQGMLELARKQKLAWLKNNVCKVSHWEPTRNIMSARSYVWKDETAFDPPIRVMWGEEDEAIKPTDRAVWMAKQGWTDSQIAEKDPKVLLMYAKGITRVRDALIKPRSWKTEVIILWGKSGVGKTFRAHQEAGPDAYWKNENPRFWGGYSGQENVVIDEFDKAPLSLNVLLRIADRYPCRIDVYGGQTEFVAKKIWITSTVDPRKWYNDPAAWPQIKRRCTVEQLVGDLGQSHNASVPPPEALLGVVSVTPHYGRLDNVKNDDVWFDELIEEATSS